MSQIQIEKVYNGYILRPSLSEAELFLSTIDLFNRLLLLFEGKADTFTGEAYGTVAILYDNKKSTHP